MFCTRTYWALSGINGVGQTTTNGRELVDFFVRCLFDLSYAEIYSSCAPVYRLTRTWHSGKVE